MNNYRSILISLLLRIVPGFGVGALGWYLLATAEGGWNATPRLLAGLGCMVVGAIIVAFPLARLVAEPSGSLFYPSGKFDRPQPLYSVGDAKRMKGLYQEAFDHFAGISAEFPQELKPYVEMMGIAIVDLKNVELAEQVFRKGLSGLTREEDLKALHAMHKAIVSRFIDQAAHVDGPVKMKNRTVRKE